MAQKRPFDDEVVNEASPKHPRQDEPGDEIVSRNDSLCIGSASEKPYDSGEPSFVKSKIGFRELENGICPVTPREAFEDIETDVARSASLSHWATSSTSDEDEPPGELVHLPVFPGYFGFDHPVRPAINPDDIYYCLLDYPPRKRVPVGPEHQAEIPKLSIQGTSDGLGKTESAGSCEGLLGNDDGRPEGVCIMPISLTEPPAYNGEKVGDGRTDCSCPDQGSIRCVQQHIAEARDKLRNTLGQDAFMELGFDDMGEEVAEKWSEEDERLFHELVYSNPASMGKNFWNVLSTVFLSRTKKEIVSYYFNVFMLRKRAEQNRCDHLNIDSDNDEWEGSGDYGGDELSEEEDSGVESPVRHNGLEFNQNGLHIQEEHEADDDGDLSDEARETDDPAAVKRFLQKSDPEFPSKKPDDDAVENDLQDGSCTSSDSGAPVEGSQLKPDGCQEWQEYMMESSDSKAWHGNNVSCPKSNEDFLPTCSMIEEVFGDGDLDSKSKR